MSDRRGVVTILPPCVDMAPSRRRNGGAFRPYGRLDGRLPDETGKRDPQPAERRRRRRGPSEGLRGKFIDLES